MEKTAGFRTATRHPQGEAGVGETLKGPPAQAEARRSSGEVAGGGGAGEGEVDRPQVAIPWAVGMGHRRAWVWGIPAWGTPAWAIRAWAIMALVWAWDMITPLPWG